MWPQVVFIGLYHLKLTKDFNCTLNLWKICQHVSSAGDSIQEALVQNLMEERSILRAKTQVKRGVMMFFFLLGWYMGLVLEHLGNKRTYQYQFHRWYHCSMGLVPERKYGKILHLLIHIMNMAYIGWYAWFSDVPIWWYPTWNRVLTTY